MMKSRRGTKASVGVVGREVRAPMVTSAVASRITAGELDGETGGTWIRRPIVKDPGTLLLLVVVAAMMATGCGDADPGSAWEIVDIPTQADIWGLRFLDAQRGYLAGGGIWVDGGLVGHTEDGGRSWELDSGLVAKRRGVMSFAFYDVCFLDDLRGFLVGHTGVLLTTSTGWRGLSQLTGGAVYAHLRSLQFVDDRFGWAVGETGILATDDGGQTWPWRGPEGEPPPRIASRAIYFTDRDHGHLAGRNGKLMRTVDGGRHWQPADTTPAASGGPHLFGLHFADARHGWAVGEHGAIWHTVDGGARWTAQDSGVNDFLLDVHFITPERGWVVGHDRELGRGVVMGSDDGGATWVVELEVPGEELYALDALPSGEAWAVGKHVGPGSQRLLRRVPPRP
jgi:photosystem II stability/assembly factor-like uncharacterized protein